ncbi:MAG TPA: hypothetical protein VKG89_07150 [Solirubrobacterales bacterium]|nr:hypothetical protein [Solirubrobacterales bacterium]
MTSGPTGPTSDPRPTFGFASPDSSAAFRCSIDTGTPDFGACSGANSHRPASDLADGSYTFRVEATRASGDSSTATRGFSVEVQAPVDATPPQLAVAGDLADADGQPLRADSASAQIQATDDAAGDSGIARIEVAVDGAVDVTNAVACNPSCPPDAGSTYTYEASDWAPGEHSVTVRAVDAAGNAKEVVLHVDSSAPQAASGAGTATAERVPAASKRRGAPQPVPAWYMNATNRHDLLIAARDDACAVARGQPNHTRLMLLNFGQARRGKDGSFGARLTLAGKYFDNGEIFEALKAAANRYRSTKCHSVGSAVIAYGNTNNMPHEMGNSEARRAGRLQAAKAHDLFRYERQQQAARSGGGFQFLGAAVGGDIEPGWSKPRISKELVDGANGGAGGTYFDFGNVGPCNRPIQNHWNRGDLGVVSRSEFARPLPEIYATCNAGQWIHVRNHWLRTHSRGYRFHGITSEPRIAGATMSPGAGWKRLNRKSSGHVGRELVNIRYSR